MANHDSAVKRARQDEVRRQRHRVHKGSMRTAIKNVLKAVEDGDVESAKSALILATSLIDRAGRKNLIHRKQSSRRVSRLTAHVKGMSS
ncbi:MAG: 30S ribosomal protein S20 [Mariprofundaceae bacterium]|nr:30S ribosomal protein S20 [Mariprofundaceae bacterium]